MAKHDTDETEITPLFIDALQGEMDWINNNLDMYESPMHAKAVIGNITKRYFADRAKKLVKEFAKKRTTGAMFAVLEHFGEFEI